MLLELELQRGDSLFEIMYVAKFGHMRSTRILGSCEEAFGRTFVVLVSSLRNHIQCIPLQQQRTTHTPCMTIDGLAICRNYRTMVNLPAASDRIVSSSGDNADKL